MRQEHNRKNIAICIAGVAVVLAVVEIHIKQY